MNHRTDNPADIDSARLDWRDGHPLSSVFGDVYYSRDDGLAEACHVFLDGNRLATRWRALDRDTFTIVETGFGTGLNFFAAARLWLDTAKPGQQLHYVSVEKYPLSRSDLLRAHQAWPELDFLSRQLVDAYPPLVPGFHRRWLFDDRICLTLIFADAIEGLADLCTSDNPAFLHHRNPRADAWFLDGFAPAKNPELWTPELFNTMARLSDTSTTLATFTVARTVRDGLAGAGFTVSKAPGFGRKRDMLVGSFTNPAVSPPGHARLTRGYEIPWHLPPEPASEKRAVIIGAGIAGCSTAAALHRRGWRVTLVDRHASVAGEASGNPQGILYPRLSTQDLALSVFGRQALCHALGVYPDLWRHEGAGAPCGVLVLPENDRDLAQFSEIAERYRAAPELVRAIDGNSLADTCGIALKHTRGLFFPNLGWVSPAVICARLATGIEYRQVNVADIEYDQKTRIWSLIDPEGEPIAEAPTVVLAMGHGTGALAQTSHLPLRRIRGQITAIGATEASCGLRTVICGAGYLAPATGGFHTLGATYDINDDDESVRTSDHQRNLDTLADTDPALPALFGSHSEPDGRTAFRCTTPDYLPVAGPAPDAEAFDDLYGELRQNARTNVARPGPTLPGLWVNCGHGSRGLTYAPLASELIAGQMNGEPCPLPLGLIRALHPARFLLRDLKRNRR